MNGLYALKPWYAQQLATPRELLARHDVSPTTVSWVGVAFGAAAGAAIAVLPSGAVAGLVVGGLLALRLAAANLDGGLARATGRSTAWGSVVNELADRLADLLAIAGLAFVAPLWVVCLAALGATLPSWVSLAGGQAAGASAVVPAVVPADLSGPQGAMAPSRSDTSGGRVQGGPVGKTERCLLLVVAAASGQAELVAGVIAVGGLVTAAARLAVIRRALGGRR